MTKKILSVKKNDSTSGTAYFCETQPICIKDFQECFDHFASSGSVIFSFM